MSGYDCKTFPAIYQSQVFIIHTFYCLKEGKNGKNPLMIRRHAPGYKGQFRRLATTVGTALICVSPLCGAGLTAAAT